MTSGEGSCPRTVRRPPGGTLAVTDLREDAGTGGPRSPHRVPTGVPLLDHALPRGVALGSTLLVAGDASSGAEVLAKGFAAAAPTLYYTSDEAPDEVRREVRRLHPGRRLEVVDLTARHRRTLARRDDGRRGALPATLFREVRARRAPRIVVDPVDCLFEAASPGEVLSALRALRRANHDAGGLLYLAKGRRTVDPRAEARLEHVGDVVLALAHERGRVEDRWEIHVRKVRNRPQDTGRFAYRPALDGRLLPDTRRRI